MNELSILQKYGFPKINDNTRIKPVVIYDTVDFGAAPTTFYTLFKQAPNNINLRNKQLPLASDEAILIDDISITNFPFDLTSANRAEVFARSYFEVIVNDTQKLKLPLYEILDFNYVSTAGSAGGFPLSQNVSKRRKLLQYPIILFKNSNISVNLVFSANAASSLTFATMRVELSGVKFDFISPNGLDPVGENVYEKTSQTFYNTVVYSDPAAVYSLFSDRTTNVLDTNKTFPLSDSEVFSIEAVEILCFSRGESSNASTALSEVSQMVLNINVNGTEFYSAATRKQSSLIQYFSGTFADVTPVNTDARNSNLFQNVYSFGFVNKGTPVIIPASSDVKITLNKPATTNLSDFITVMLKGTLERRIS